MSGDIAENMKGPGPEDPNRLSKNGEKDQKQEGPNHEAMAEAVSGEHIGRDRGKRGRS
jgi:hypothetical protein